LEQAPLWTPCGDIRIILQGKPALSAPASLQALAGCCDQGQYPPPGSGTSRQLLRSDLVFIRL
jgi:hypothetical protein